MMNCFLNEAIEEAKKGLKEGGIPIGSIIVHKNKIIGRGHNRRVQNGSVVLHGEMDAFRKCWKTKCFGLQRVSFIYNAFTMFYVFWNYSFIWYSESSYWRNNTFLGEETLLKDKGVEVIVANNQECIDIMTSFIKDKPELWNEDIGE